MFGSEKRAITWSMRKRLFPNFTPPYPKSQDEKEGGGDIDVLVQTNITNNITIVTNRIPTSSMALHLFERIMEVTKHMHSVLLEFATSKSLACIPRFVYFKRSDVPKRRQLSRYMSPVLSFALDNGIVGGWVEVVCR